MKFLHITDIHLDHLQEQTRPVYIAETGKTKRVTGLKEFVDYYQHRIVADGLDGIFLTGDITTCQHLPDHLKFLAEMIKCPIYFILGNHDYYGGDKIMGGLSQKFATTCDRDLGPATTGVQHSTNLHYMTARKESIIQTTEEGKKIAIVGSDGWYDGEYAYFSRSELFMTDFVTIKEFKTLFKETIKEKTRSGQFYPMTPGDSFFSYHREHGLPYPLQKKFKDVAMEFTKILDEQIVHALANDVNEIVVLTHVPPYENNSQYRGKVSDEDWMPYFSSKFCGDAVRIAALNNPKVKFTVLCGHSHADVTNQVRENLVCYTTAAEYRQIYAGRVLEF